MGRERGTLVVYIHTQLGIRHDTKANQHSPVTFCPKPNVGFGVSVGSVAFPNANASLGSSFGGSGLLKLKPTEGAGLSASLAVLNTNPVEGVEISFFSSR